MVFNELTIVILFFIIISWSSILSFGLYRMMRHYNRLTEGITKTGLREILDAHLSRAEDTTKQIIGLDQTLKQVQSDGILHIQRIGIVRFNPFSDTGGAQSFTIAFLDGNNTGVVMTSLYARSGNRWYVKEIQKGVGQHLELSKEEQTAVKQARIVAQ